LAGAGRRGKDTVCLQNLARIAQASITYAAEDPDEQAVPVHPLMESNLINAGLRRTLATACYGGKSGRGREGSDQMFWGTARGKGPATRPLNRILYGDVLPGYESNPGPGSANWKNDEVLELSFYRCPSDSGYPGALHLSAWRDSRLTSFDHYGTSYAAATLWIYVPGAVDCPPGIPGNCCHSNSAFLHRLTDVPNPQESVYYLENCGRFAYYADPVDVTGCGIGAAGVVSGWHGQPWLFNAAFVDGHVAATQIRGYRSPRPGHYPDDGGWGDPYMYWRCVIIRGDLWQFDTLPLHPVESSIPCSFARGCGDAGERQDHARPIPEEDLN